MKADKVQAIEITFVNFAVHISYTECNFHVETVPHLLRPFLN